MDEKLVRAVAAAQARQNSAAATIADLYLMGLGALEGIGCERDCKRGCDMILASTLAGLLDAKKQLAFMYRFGKGVARDPQSAAKWTQDALVQARAAFAPLDALDHDTLLVTAFCQLVGIILPFLMKIKSDFSMCSVESPITTD